jgi:hypothetical protein
VTLAAIQLTNTQIVDGFDEIAMEYPGGFTPRRGTTGMFLLPAQETMELSS